MRPVLVQLPSKLLFAVALVWAIVAFVLDVRRARAAQARGEKKIARSSTPLMLLIGAFALMRLRGHSFVPTVATFTAPWEPVPIHSYGVMLGLSMIVGWFLAMRLAKQDGIPSETAGNIYMWTAVWSIVGARLLYCIVMIRTMSFLDFFKIWEGGLVAYGGMIGGFLASWYNCRKAGVALLRWADVAAPSVVLGTAITRIGCLLFGCDYGKRSDLLPWAIQFPRESPAFKDHVQNLGLPSTALQSFPVHPTQLYEMLAGLFLFALLMFLRRVRRFSGQVFLGWVIGYGILRPIIEGYRDDDQRGSVGPLSTSQFIGVVSVLLGVALLVALLRRYRKDPQALRLWEQPLALKPAPAAGGAAPRAPAGGINRGQRRRKS